MNSTFAFILPYSSNLETFLTERWIKHKVYGFNAPDDKDYIRISTTKRTSESEESTAWLLAMEYSAWLIKQVN